LAVADAHPLGARPWRRPDYVQKFRMLTDGLIEPAEAERFLSAVKRLPDLEAGALAELDVALPAGTLVEGRGGLF